MDPFVGEIRLFAGNFDPEGWAFCDGRLLAISEYETLFNLIGTTYGGDGQTTFALPDLRGRIPIHMGNNAGITYSIGEMGGTETVTLTSQQIPAHNHPALGGVNGEYNSPAGHVWASWPGTQYAGAPAPLATGSPVAILPAGGSQPHENRPPFLAVSFIICLFGIYPSQT